MIDAVTLNARKPKDNEYGLAMLNRMNERHKNLHKWGIEHISLDNIKTLLDIGFGGGQNIKNMCEMLPNAKIYGIDYSKASYKRCAELNDIAIKEGRVELTVGSAENLPYSSNSFDVVTAFETVYYWPNIENCFKNIYSVLRENGVFLICNEDSSLVGNEEIADTLDMKFYNESELEEYLKEAGFKTVNTYRHEDGKWICAVAIK